MKKWILLLALVAAVALIACDKRDSPTEPNNPWVVDYIVRDAGDETMVVRGARITITSHSLDVPYLESDMYGMTPQVTIYQRVEPETTTVAVTMGPGISIAYDKWSGTVVHTKTWDPRSTRYVWRGIIRLAKS